MDPREPTISKEVGGYMHGIGNVQTRVDACRNEGKNDGDVFLEVKECFLGEKRGSQLMDPTDPIGMLVVGWETHTPWKVWQTKRYARPLPPFRDGVLIHHKTMGIQ